MREHVLVYHYARSTKECQGLRDFLKKRQITFVSVDKRTDIKMMQKEKFDIPDEYHVDIQDIFKSVPRDNHRDGMSKLAATLIDRSYIQMKTLARASNMRHI